MMYCRFCLCKNTTTCYDGEWWWVRCDSCAATGPKTAKKENAEKMWDGNMRPDVVFHPIYRGEVEDERNE